MITITKSGELFAVFHQNTPQALSSALDLARYQKEAVILSIDGPVVYAAYSEDSF